MPFRIKRPDRVSQEIERIVLEQIDRALGELEDTGLDCNETIHQVRKRCKKLRGLLRLVRCDIGKHYKRENIAYRDAARLLSGARDAAVMRKVYDRLMERYGDEVDRPAFGVIRRHLTERMKAMVDEAEVMDAKLEDFRGRILEARERVPDWASGVGELPRLLVGMEKTYERGYAAAGKAGDDPTPETIHEWRKRTKYHWYHCRLLRGVWRPMMEMRADEAKRLSDLLGDAHDLSVFHKLLREQPELGGDLERREVVLALVERRRKALRRKARACGSRLFANKPKKFRKEMSRFVEAWEGG